LTETDYVLECGADARIQLDDEVIPLRPGVCVMIPPGVPHRAIGRMRVLIVVVPKFDPADEWLDGPTEARPMPTIRSIAQLGHPVLREPARPAALPASDALRALVDDMLATLRDADGVGIAAPQVYEGIRLFVVASKPNPRYPDAPAMEPEVVVNPEIVERSAAMVKGWEGCLSIPGIRGEVPRHPRIRARYRTLGGDEVEREFEGFVARVFQHEDDHLRGLVFLDRLESPRDIVTEKEYRKLLDR
jgi:peptide deformylase